ncbi:MAG: hypothetical protein QNJ32_23880 [Xenococcaceae cyanobacterium MO_167.B27]|nr:hypothetical protein [Xenococcaceae cyanobacterium MO_167.B27]
MWKKQEIIKVIRTLVVSSVLSSNLLIIEAFTKPANSTNSSYCRFTPQETAKKEQLLKAYLQGDSELGEQYKTLVQQHGKQLDECRQHTWPREQAIWLRLYPCDATAGSLDSVLDHIVNLGYNRVHLEVFYDSRVLLPAADNTTPWNSVVNTPGAENIDLLKQAIAKGRERGLKVYAWLFTMNFGYTYAQRSDRQDTLARNGRGENSLNFVSDRSQAFIDPYNRQAQIDFYRLVQKVLERNPDGILFDYIRYPRGSGQQSLVRNVRDLWIYSPASLQALLQRAGNQKGRALIERFVKKGAITPKDILEIDRLYPQENAPTWQGRKVNTTESNISLQERHLRLQSDLWFLTVAHAAQGIIDFLSFVSNPARERQIPPGAVFFPDANRLVGQAGFDSRLQPWDKFPSFLEWHPMAYSICKDASCIVNEVKTVLQTAPEGTKITPALAGVWGSEYRNHPSLEVQMEALRKATPQINSVSHFAYSWQQPERDHQRRFCSLQ